MTEHIHVRLCATIALLLMCCAYMSPTSAALSLEIQKKHASKQHRADDMCANVSGKLNASLCSSPCVSLRNVIVLYSPPGKGAGLEDRANIISILGAYAEAMCAILIVPKPCVMLGSHNMGGEINCNMNWTSYLDLRQASGIIQDSSVLRPGKAVSPSLLGLEGPYEVIDDEDLGQALYYSRYGPSIKPFFLAFNMGDIWFHMHGCGARIRNELHEFGCTAFFKPRKTGEGGTEFKGIVGSPMAERAAAGIISGFDAFSVLHLRRGDMKKNNCDSTPEKVEAFLKCRLGSFNGFYPALFVFTDETNATYIESIIAVARRFSVHVAHGDALAKAELVKAGLAYPDNYLVYSVSNMVKIAATKLNCGVWKFTGCDRELKQCKPEVKPEVKSDVKSESDLNKIETENKALRGESERLKKKGKRADLTPPQISSLASPHRPKASDGSLEPRRREYL